MDLTILCCWACSRQATLRQLKTPPDIAKCPLGQNQPWLRTTVPYLSTVMSDIANYSQIAAFLSLLWAVIKYSVGHTLLRFFFKLHGSSDSVSTSFRLFENRTIPSVPWVLPQSPQSSPWHGVNTRKNLLRYCSLTAWKDLKAPGGPTWSQGDAV